MCTNSLAEKYGDNLFHCDVLGLLEGHKVDGVGLGLVFLLSPLRDILALILIMVLYLDG